MLTVAQYPNCALRNISSRVQPFSRTALARRIATMMGESAAVLQSENEALARKIESMSQLRKHMKKQTKRKAEAAARASAEKKYAFVMALAAVVASAMLWSIYRDQMQGSAANASNI